MLLEFNTDSIRPLIKVCSNTSTIDCLLDTGAYMPVWCDTIRQLQYDFPNCYYSNLVTEIGGFGEGTQFAPIYIIPDFKFSDGKHTVHYMNMPVAVLLKPYSFQLILSYTMFNTANISINTFSSNPAVHKIKPIIRFKYQRQKLGVTLRRKNIITTKPLPYNAQGLVDTILVFYQK